MTKVHVNYQIRVHAQNLPIIGGVRQREVEEYDASACLMGKSAQFFFTYLVQPSVADVDRFWGHVFV